MGVYVLVCFFFCFMLGRKRGGKGRWNSLLTRVFSGDKNAMGVFIWATNSDINHRVKGVPIVELPGANFSVVDAADILQTS